MGWDDGSATTVAEQQGEGAGMLDALPISMLDASGWGALGAFLILSYFLFHKGVFKTSGEYNRMVTSFTERITEAGNQFAQRIADLKEFYEARLSDKDAVISEKNETIKFLNETVDVQSQSIADLARQNETTEHVIQAIQQVSQGVRSD
jgi:hypothetical protein